MNSGGILEAIYDQLNKQWRGVMDDAPNIHLAFFREPYLQWILDGKKTIESRFSMNRVLPWGKVENGDVVLLKRSGGPIVGLFVVERGERWSVLSDGGWNILRAYSDEIGADEAFWEERKHKRYAILLWICQVRRLIPIDIDKVSGDRRAWIVLREGKKNDG
jgi:hypothetical protein